jgi:2-phosphoglycerate kinase
MALSWTEVEPLRRIYLLGGTANAGKTTCANGIAEQCGSEVCSIDRVRGELQEVAPRIDPINYLFDCSWLDVSPEESLKHKTDVARRTCGNGVAPLVERLLLGERDVIIEGDDLLPEFVEQWLMAGVAGAAFLVETDPRVIGERYSVRDQTLCIRGDQTRLDRFVAHYLGWARWLQSEASRRKLATIDARGGADVGDVALALGL